jgi:hypothetical protein
MPVNWPPSFAQPFPGQFSRAYFEDQANRQGWLRSFGVQRVAATQAERDLLDTVRCDAGHAVVGIALERSSDGARWLAAVCDTPHDATAGARSRAFLVPFAPWHFNDFERS